MKYLITPILLLCAIGVYADSYETGTYPPETIQQGEDFVRYVTVTDDAGHPVDISGRRYIVQFRPNPSSTQVFANFSTPVTVPSTGQFSVILHSSTTQSLGGKVGYWDAREIAPNGTIGYLWKGQLQVAPTVSR